MTCELDGDTSCGQSDSYLPTAKAMSITSGLAQSLSGELTFGQSLSKKLTLGVATLATLSNLATLATRAQKKSWISCAIHSEYLHQGTLWMRTGVDM